MNPDISDETPERFARGVQALIDGETILLYGVEIRHRNSEVHVSVNTQWRYENLSERQARKELARAQFNYATLLELYPVAAERLGHLRTVFELGTLSCLICTLEGDKLTWIGTPPT